MASLRPRRAKATACLTALTLLAALAGPGPRRAAAAYSTLISANYIASVADIADAFFSPFPAPAGSAAYPGGTAGTAVCASEDSTTPIYPMPAAVARALFGTARSPGTTATTTDAVLDGINGCYMDSGDTCVRWLASTPAQCNGRVGDAMSTGAAAANTDASPATSAAALAALVGRNAGAEQYRLSRSLRRSREVKDALATLAAMAVNGTAAAKSPAESAALLQSLSQRAAALVLAHHAIILEKYDVVRQWLPSSLGAGGNPAVGNTNILLGADAVSCPASSALDSLLLEDNTTKTVLLAFREIASTGDTIVRTPAVYPVAERGLLCLQGLFAISAMAVEDANARCVHRMLVSGELSETEAWPLDFWKRTLGIDVTDMVRRIGRVVELSIQGTVKQGLYLASDTAATAKLECAVRVFLRSPYEENGLVPPSLGWCYQHGHAPGGVAPLRRDADVSAGIIATNSATTTTAPTVVGCSLGYSVWDGSCRAVAERTCTRCPAGSVASPDGVCVCPRADEYATTAGSSGSGSVGGCVARAGAGEPPVLDWHMPSMDTTVNPASDFADGLNVALLTAALPRATLLADPSAHLVVEIECGRGDLTTFTAVASGTRKAVCAAGVQYERRQESLGNGLRAAVPGATITALTYAQTLTVGIAGSSALLGDICLVRVRVGSSVHISSAAVFLGVLRVVPSAAEVSVAAVNPPVAGSPVPDCAAVAAGTNKATTTTTTTVYSGSANILVGVCTLAETGRLSLYVDTRRYRAVGDGAMDALAGSAASGADRNGLLAVARALRGCAGLRVTLVDVAGKVLGSSQWAPDGNEGGDTAGGSWQPVLVLPVGQAVLERAATVQVEVLDVANGTAFAPRTAWTDFYFELNAPVVVPPLPPPADSRSSSGSASHSDAPTTTTTTTAAPTPEPSANSSRDLSHRRIGGSYIAGIVIVLVLLAVAVIVLIYLVFTLLCGSASLTVLAATATATATAGLESGYCEQGGPAAGSDGDGDGDSDGNDNNNRNTDNDDDDTDAFSSGPSTTPASPVSPRSPGTLTDAGSPASHASSVPPPPPDSPAAAAPSSSLSPRASSAAVSTARSMASSSSAAAFSSGDDGEAAEASEKEEDEADADAYFSDAADTVLPC